MRKGEAERFVRIQEVATKACGDGPGAWVDECHVSYVLILNSYVVCVFHISKNITMKCKEYIEYNRKEHVMDI